MLAFPTQNKATNNGFDRFDCDSKCKTRCLSKQSGDPATGAAGIGIERRNNSIDRVAEAFGVPVERFQDMIENVGLSFFIQPEGSASTMGRHLCLSPIRHLRMQFTLALISAVMVGIQNL